MLDNIKLIRKNVKYSNIKVKPNLDVIFTAPINMSQCDINRIINKRADWVRKQLEYFRQFQTAIQKELVSGEDVQYLGRNYRLKVVESTIEEIKLSSGYIIIYVNDKNSLKKKQQLIEQWYYMKAGECFKKLINKYQQIVGREINKISIRKMKTRWGSCNPMKSYINLNLELIKYSPYAIEYVIFHELAHLIYYNHDKHFYNYLSAYMPDWQLRRDKLHCFIK